MFDVFQKNPFQSGDVDPVAVSILTWKWISMNTIVATRFSERNWTGRFAPDIADYIADFAMEGFKRGLLYWTTAVAAVSLSIT
jgi:hypothetical protein